MSPTKRGEPVPAVFVNGNPETAAIWGPLVERIGRDDVVLLSPPGFGSPTSDRFPSTPDGYRDWLVDALEATDGPVDLVGHDIGGSTALAVAMTRPDLLRTWASDSLGVMHPDYRWHELARVWQTPGDGERSVEELLSAPEEVRAERLRAMGMPAGVARSVAAGQGAAMGRSILSFYRAAAQPAMAVLGEGVAAAAARPGLAIIGTADEYVGTEAMRRESAARAGAEVAVLAGRGHLWMLEAPDEAAAALAQHWSRGSR